MAETKSTLVLRRSTLDDMDKIVQTQYDSFPQFIRETFMGCASEKDLPRVIADAREDFQTDPHLVWIQVVEEETNCVVAASQWKIYPNVAPASSADDTPAPWLDGEARVRTERMLASMNAKRREANPGGYVHLHICFTHPDFRRRGAGSMMMQWGCDVADALNVPGWIEASPEGNFLYKRFGFYDYEQIKDEDLGGTNMRRDARQPQDKLK